MISGGVTDQAAYKLFKVEAPKVEAPPRGRRCIAEELANK